MHMCSYTTVCTHQVSLLSCGADRHGLHHSRDDAAGVTQANMQQQRDLRAHWVKRL